MRFLYCTKLITNQIDTIVYGICMGRSTRFHCTRIVFIWAIIQIVKYSCVDMHVWWLHKVLSRGGIRVTRETEVHTKL